MTSSARTHPITAALVVLLMCGTTGCEDPLGSAENAQPPPPPPSPGTAAPSPGPSPTPSPPTPVPSPSPELVIGPLARDVLTDDIDGPVRFEVALDDPVSATELAAVIVATEEAVRDPSLSPEARLVAAHRGQRAYRQLATTPAWQEEVLGALPERWRFVTRQNLITRQALDRLRGSGDPPTTMPAWEITQPEPAEALLSYYREAEEAIGADWELLAAINLVETRMGRIVGFSTAQARGPMQFIPESWEIFGAGGDIDDARDSIFAAARHLTERPGDPPSDRGALLRYNRSPDYADAVLAVAEVLREDPSAYAAYHGWQVYFGTPQGEFLLPVGYREEEPVPIDAYLARPGIEVVG